MTQIQTFDPTPQNETPTQLVHALHECNRDLISRVTELETELETYQRALQEKETLLVQRGQELEMAEEQVTRLFGKLEMTNQVVRRQQVLVETLTEQWESGQARMAQMERECATTQQQYNEQYSELIQAQNACQELRSRLNRQQRHSLQFKVALERCLEMQPPDLLPENPPEKTPQKPLEQLPQPDNDPLGIQPITLSEDDPLGIQPITRSAPGIDPVVEFAMEVEEPPQPEPILPRTADLHPHSITLLRATPVQPWSAARDSPEISRLDEIARLDLEANANPFELGDDPENLEPDLDPQALGQEIPPSMSMGDLPLLETYWHIEPSAQPLTNPPEPRPTGGTETQVTHDELNHIRLKYASIADASALEENPELSSDPNYDLKPEPYPAPKPEIDWETETDTSQVGFVIHSSEPDIRELTSNADVEMPAIPAAASMVTQTTPESAPTPEPRGSNWHLLSIDPKKRTKRRSPAAIELPNIPPQTAAGVVTQDVERF
ncbi:MAG: hypothetical protein ACFBSC_07200 [Microcoleaceae cyanobacterium]